MARGWVSNRTWNPIELGEVEDFFGMERMMLTKLGEGVDNAQYFGHFAGPRRGGGRTVLHRLGSIV